MTGGQKYYWQKMCQNVCEPEKSRIFAPLFERALGYGVMVTLQILVLPFLVRVRVAQRKRERRGRVSLFFVWCGWGREPVLKSQNVQGTS